MSSKDIQNAIKKQPQLTNHGIGIYRNGRGLTLAQRKEKFDEDQRLLLKSVDAFEKACQWLSTKSKIKTINKRHSSYGLKHMAEKEIGYVTNGVFIAAAIHCGYNVQVSPDGPNVSINISEKSLKSY